MTWSPSLVLVLLRLPEALTVQCFSCHLHHGLNLWIHVKDAFLAHPLHALRHKMQVNYLLFYFKVKKKKTFRKNKAVCKCVAYLNKLRNCLSCIHTVLCYAVVSHLLRLRWFSDGPHFHGVHGEVLLPGELRAAVRGTLWPCSAVAPPKVTVQPQTKVAVLTAHPLAERRAESRRCQF